MLRLRRHNKLQRLERVFHALLRLRVLDELQQLGWLQLRLHVHAIVHPQLHEPEYLAELLPDRVFLRMAGLSVPVVR
jgi:hypothetical protein